jgi:hypothetical protein
VPFAHPHGVEVRAGSGRIFLSSSWGMDDPPATEDPGVSTPPSGTTTLATATLATGEALRFVEIADGAVRPTMCVFAEAATSPSTCLPEDLVGPASGPYLAPMAGSALELPSGVHSVHAVGLPAGHARPVIVRAANGAIWPSAEGTTRDTLVIVDPTPFAGAGPLRDTLDVVSPDGTVVTRVGPPGAGPAAVPSGFPALGACYRANGADYHAEPAGAPTDSPPTTLLPAEVTAAAWQACRDVHAAAAGGGGDEDLAAYHTCMAAQGWLPPLWFQHREQWAAASAVCGRPVTGLTN